MIATDRDGTGPGSLARLPMLAPDAARADRTRRRCRALLERQRRQRDYLLQHVDMARPRPRPLVVGVFCLFCLVYVSELMATTFRLQGLIR
jgi:hypothetical protein